MVVDLDMDRPRAGHETSQHGAFSIVCILLPLTWFKVPLEITRSGSGADLLKDVSKYHRNTRTVEFDLSRPLFLD